MARPALHTVAGFMAMWLLAHSALLSAQDAGQSAPQPSALGARVAALDARVHALERRAGELALATSLETLIKTIDPAADSAATTDDVHAVRFKDITTFETDDRRYKLTIQGLVQNDWTFGTQNDEFESAFRPIEDGTRFRRVRLGLGGRYDNVEFRTQFDMADGEVDLSDVWLAIAPLEELTIRVGHQREPFGIDQLTSGRDTTFRERATGSVFAPLRNTGIQVLGNLADDRFGFALGFFRETDSFGDNRDLPGVSGFEFEDGAYAGTGRVFGTPVREPDGSVWQLGVAASLRNPAEDQVRVRQRPGARIAPFVVATGAVDADSVVMVAIETLAAIGPFWLQAEVEWFDVSAGDDATFLGWHAQCGVFLTGESRPYEPQSGVFGRVRPIGPLAADGPGAVELAFRASGLDLNSGSVRGGEVLDFTTAVNWYPSANTRVGLDWIVVLLDDEDASAHIVTLRFQFDF